MVRDRPADVLLAGSDDEPRGSIALGRLGSAVAAAIAVHLLLSVSLVADAQRADPDVASAARRRRAVASPSPTPPPPRRPVSGREAEVRRERAMVAARFAAGLVCRDSSRFEFRVVESTVDLVESVIDARDPQRPEAAGIVVKVTVLPALAYRVLSENGECDA